MLHCDRCGEEAIVTIRYSGAHLCNLHFTSFVEKRAKREVRSQLRLADRTRIACALSGGKDSSVATYLLHTILGKRRDVELVAVTVDEGIDGYRPASISFAERLCQELDLDHRIVAYKELVGWEMDEVVEADPGTIPCSYCGVFRRKALNSLAKLVKADYLSTGLNLDDTVQSFLMNLGRADRDRLARMGPHDSVQAGLVRRVQPLRTIPEKEVYLYALLKGIPFDDGTCPYADRAMRTRYREVLYELENEFPGTRHAMLSTYDSLKPYLVDHYPPAELATCEQCGEPTISEICQACKLLERLESISSRSA